MATLSISVDVLSKSLVFAQQVHEIGVAKMEATQAQHDSLQTLLLFLSSQFFRNNE